MERPMVDRVERLATRMHAVMRKLGVDPAWLARQRGGQAYAEARTRCLVCPDGDRCQAWLDDPSTGRPPPDFCPNLKAFANCRKRPPDAA